MRKSSAASSDLSAVRNLGPKSTAMLAAAGITTLAELRASGAVAVYLRVRRVEPKASLNLLWALEGALCGLPWRDVARDHRTRLLMALEDADRLPAR